MTRMHLSTAQVRKLSKFPPRVIQAEVPADLLRSRYRESRRAGFDRGHARFYALGVAVAVCTIEGPVTITREPVKR